MDFRYQSDTSVYYHRVREMKGVKVIDVDGSYLYRKKLSLTGVRVTPTIPAVPLIGWERVDLSGQFMHLDKIPKVTHGE